jgi:hypothetical protein
MIRNVTHNEQNQPIIQITRAYKVSIGIPATADSNFPQKSDHFHIRSRNAKGEWVDDKKFMAQLQELYMPLVDVDDGKGNVSQIRVALREFDIIFLSDDIEEIFPTEYAWWATSEKKCSGHGCDDAFRRVTALPEKERLKYPGVDLIPWKPCGEGCPELESSKCKPTGELRFIFKDRPVMGSIAALSTTSYQSIKRIHSSLLQIQSVTGGRLRGIPLKIVVRPGKTRYIQDGKAKSSMAFFVNIEFREEDYSRLVPALLERSASYEKSLTTGRRMLTEAVDAEDDAIDVEGARIEETPEAERAAEMTSEFFPENRTASASKPEPDADDQAITLAFNSLGLSPAHKERLYQSLKGDIASIREWITDFGNGVASLKLSASATQEFYMKIVVQPHNLKAGLQALVAAKVETAAEQRAPARSRKGTAKKAAEVPPATSTPAPVQTQQPTPEKREEPKPAPPAEPNLGTFTF